MTTGATRANPDRTGEGSGGEGALYEEGLVTVRFAPPLLRAQLRTWVHVPMSGALTTGPHPTASDVHRPQAFKPMTRAA